MANPKKDEPVGGSLGLDKVVEKVLNYLHGYGKTEPADIPEGDEMGSSRELIDALTELDAKYRAEKMGLDYAPITNIPDSLGLEKIGYDQKDLTELTDEVAVELDAKYAGDREKSERDYIKDVRDIESEVDKTRLKESEEINKLTESAAAEARSLTEDMVLQGLVNSTVYDLGAEGIVKKSAEEFQKLSAEYDVKYQKLDAELKERESEYREALEAFDLKYAAELKAGVQKLKLEEEKRLKEINDYNASVTERENAYRAERQQLLNDLYVARTEAIMEAARAEREEELQTGVSEEKRAEYRRRFELAKAFYSRFTPEETGKMLEESRLYLGVLLGDDMFNELGRWNFLERK